MNTFEMLTRTDGVFENIRQIEDNLRAVSQTLAGASTELRKAQADLYLWKQCADNLAKHVQGVSDEDCRALENYERLKGLTR